MNKLLDEENEEDEVFWNQDALRDEEHDNNYEEEQEAADVFDSDFDEDEPEPENETENDGEERKTRKRLIYPGKPVLKKKELLKLDKADVEEELPKESIDVDQHDGPDDGEGERVVRKSTRTSVVVRQAERDAIRAAMQATMKPIKRKKEGEEKKMTQEEMLLEAARTEIMNLRNLERVLAREEEIKKKAIVNKPVYSGPQIRYLSKNGCSYLEFSKGSSFQSEISTTAAAYPDKAVCAVTGLPAKYRDPKTGLPYATKEAFKTIRERYWDESGCVRKRMDMGKLFDSLSGTDFGDKQKRTLHTSNKRTDLRSLSRFCRIPALDTELSD
jgi:vacuolar protein sorting-associated protein 72